MATVTNHLNKVTAARFIEVCNLFSGRFRRDNRIRFKEPYYPYIPFKWNGILVLAESQNLSTIGPQVSPNWLENLPQQDKFSRLYRYSDGLGVWPWDNGALKLALTAAYLDDPTFNCKKVAVSNAVPWSKIKKSGANENPDDEMKTVAIEFWKALFGFWRPDKIIASGNFAENVLLAAGFEKEKLQRIYLSCSTAINPRKRLFNENDLLTRYPEVVEARKKLESLGLSFVEVEKEIGSDGLHFFACHAVSLLSKL